MKKILLLFLFLFLFTACGSGTEVPVVESTPTPVPRTIPTTIPGPTVEAIITPTVEPVNEFPNERVSSIDGMPQVYIPAGTFRMGGMDVRAAPDEMPNRDVTLHAFWMDQLEVTNAMYALCMDTGVCEPPQSFKSQRRTDYFDSPEFKDYPVVYVTWDQAAAYCEWAGRRLPTEAEWERAARGDDFRTFPWGEDKPDGRFANFNFIVKDTSRVGSYPLGASPFGVLDMAGNVAEWTNDFYSFNYHRSDHTVNPTGPAASASFNRVVRGGSLGDAEVNIRVSKRSSVRGSKLNAVPGSSDYLGDFSPRIGFRCAEDEELFN
jgi:formylglycine-generating enzyme required for sulfatase activity